MTPIERKIATKVIEDVLAAGYEIGIVDSESKDKNGQKSTDAAAILAELHQHDRELLLIYPKKSAPTASRLGWIEFAYNNGHNLIADYCGPIQWLLKGAKKLACDKATKETK